MPEKETLRRARRAKSRGKSSSTQAAEFVREELRHIREGKHGARSTRQAIAIGLLKARGAGVKLGAPPRRSKASTRRKVAAVRRAAARRRKLSARRSTAVRRVLRRESRRVATRKALRRRALAAARRRTAAARRLSARRVARTRRRVARTIRRVARTRRRARAHA